MKSFEANLSRDLTGLAQATDLVDEFLAEYSLSQQLTIPLTLIVEELFTNFIKYNTEGAHRIKLVLSHSGDRVLAVIRDRDVHDFDLTRTPPIDTTRPLGERNPGGLGIHLIKSIADELHYEYVNGDVVITVVKRLEESCS